jgi:hypothetical protein
MSKPWPAPKEIWDMVEELKGKYHAPQLDNATVAVAMKDDKPFVKNRLNFGKVSRPSPAAQIWMKEPHTFCITLCADVWQGILKPEQQIAMLDLHLTCCEPAYEPETVLEGKKKIVVKDEFGRVKFTNTIKKDKDGDIVWQVLPMDIVVIGKNVQRFGLWWTDVEDFAQTVIGVGANEKPAD